MTRGWLPQKSGLPGLNGGGAAAAVPSSCGVVRQIAADIFCDSAVRQRTTSCCMWTINVFNYSDIGRYRTTPCGIIRYPLVPCAVWNRDDHGNPWESHGNGNWWHNWEWEWEGMGITLYGNGNGPYSHGNKFPSADSIAICRYAVLLSRTWDSRTRTRTRSQASRTRTRALAGINTNMLRHRARSHVINCVLSLSCHRLSALDIKDIRDSYVLLAVTTEWAKLSDTTLHFCF